MAKDHPQTVHVTPPKSHRFLLLDALRGLAALVVVAFHFPPQMWSVAPRNGLLAVDFFFCLSGFVIAFSYEHRLAESLSFKDFLAARWIRLYPVYLLGSALGLIMWLASMHLTGMGIQSPAHWLVVVVFGICMWPVNLSTVSFPFLFPLDSPAWSLFYEVIANVGFAVLVKARATRSAMFGLIIAVSLGFLSYSLAHRGTLDVGYTGSTFGLGFARVALSFSTGILVHRLYRATKTRSAAWRFDSLAAALVTLCLLFILISPVNGMTAEPFRLVAVVLCFPLLVYVGAFAHIPDQLSRVCVALGELSYPLYLFHMPLLGILYARHTLRLSAAHPALTHVALLLFLALLAASAWWVGDRVDLPLRRSLGQRYRAASGKKVRGSVTSAVSCATTARDAGGQA